MNNSFEASSTFSLEQVQPVSEQPKSPEVLAEMLMTGEVVIYVEYMVNDGGHKPFNYVELDNGLSGVFKPWDQEPSIVENSINPEIRHINENAAFLIDNYMGLDLVPPTVVREVNGVEGSLQLYINGGKSFKNATSEERAHYQEVCHERFLLMQLFDFVIWSLERHTANIFLKDDEVYAIDNGLSLKTGEDLFPIVPAYSVPVDYQKDPIPRGVVEKFQNAFSKGKDEMEVFRKKLSNLIGFEIQDVFTRMEILANVLIPDQRIPKDLALGLEYWGKNPDKWRDEMELREAA